jgi:thymidylate synthase ThyX
MSYDAKILADSISPAGHRVTTLQVTFPRLILAEFNTHRVFSRNSASSRAIPVERRIEQIMENPFVPEAFGKNQKGMQASEVLDGDQDSWARTCWLVAVHQAVGNAERLADIGVHKQHANRVIETYAWHTVVVTATEWANWDALRVSRMAQPEMFKIAGMMREVRQASTPIFTDYGDWHLPFIKRIPLETTDGGTKDVGEAYWLLGNGFDPVKVCVGRCAAVSYERHDNTTPEKASAICDKLRADGHMSPFEHALRPMTPHEMRIFRQEDLEWNGREWTPTPRWVRHFLGNVEGWVQYRKLLPGEAVYCGE